MKLLRKRVVSQLAKNYSFTNVARERRKLYYVKFSNISNKWRDVLCVCIMYSNICMQYVLLLLCTFLLRSTSNHILCKLSFKICTKAIKNHSTKVNNLESLTNIFVYIMYLVVWTNTLFIWLPYSRISPFENTPNAHFAKWNNNPDKTM